VDRVPARNRPNPSRSLACARGRELREAWTERGEDLLDRYLTPPLTPGRRPAAWWTFEARRPEYLSEVDYGSHDLELITREDHEREIEKFTWLAEHNHLAPIELELIEARGRAAAERIGTDHEQQAACSPDFGGDNLDAALAEAVAAALSPFKRGERYISKFQYQGKQRWTPGGPWKTKREANEAERLYRDGLEIRRSEETSPALPSGGLRSGRVALRRHGEAMPRVRGASLRSSAQHPSPTWIGYLHANGR
jgi:hypothetical protein